VADTQPTRTSNFELRDYFRIVWTRKWTAFIVLVLVATGVMVLSFRQTPVYQSTVQLIVLNVPQTNNAAGEPTVQRIDPEVEARIAASPLIADRVQHVIPWAHDVNPQQLLNFMTVAPLKQAGTILVFQAQHPNPQRAADLATAFAGQYLQYSVDQVIEPFATARDKWQQQYQDDSQQLTNFNIEHPTGPGGVPRVTEPKPVTQRRTELQAAVAIDQQNRDNNASSIEQIKSDAETRIISPARVAHHPIRPNHFRDAVFAVIIGLALGIGAAFLRDYADDSLRGPDDLERQAGAPLLGVIPHVSSKAAAKGRRSEQYLVSVADPKAPATESYRTLRTNLLFFSVGGPIRRLLIASPVKGEGKSTTAANLATVMALAGQRVLLIGADLRRPSIHKFFGLSNRVGLSSVLSGQATLMEAIQDPGVKGLRVMAGGPVPPNPAELLGSVAMKQFLEQAADAADWVILDGPPVLGLADASVLATLSDAVLLVVNEATNRRVLAHARDQLAKVRSRVVGAVLNNFGPATSYYYYADYYAYTSAYYYEAESEEKGRKQRRKDRKAKRDAKSGRTGRGSEAAAKGFVDDVDVETGTAQVPVATPAEPAPPKPVTVQSAGFNSPASTNGGNGSGNGTGTGPGPDEDPERSTTSSIT
jgi:non-specific protein-tyrosine kinase